MCLGDFLTQLFKTGQVEMPPGPDPLISSPSARRQLGLAYEADSWHFPGLQPGWNPEAGETAASWLAAAALCFSDRTIDSTTVKKLLSLPAPPLTLCDHYSADLVLRYVPELYHLAQSLSPEDPLIFSIRKMADLFPLSAPGIPGESLPPSEVLNDPALRRLYLDRLIERRDCKRLIKPSISVFLSEVEGDHPELLSSLYPLLTSGTDLHGI